MAIIKPPVLPAWADTGDKTQPTNAEIETGWPFTNVPPSRQRFNWILNFCANGVRYFSRRGIADWDSTETYLIGDRVIGPDNKTYASRINANINFTPATSPTQWEIWAPSIGELSDLLRRQTYTRFTTTGTAPAFVLTPSPALASYVAGTRFAVSFHASGTTGNTIDISGLGSLNLISQNAAGAFVEANIKTGLQTDIVLDGAGGAVVMDSLPDTPVIPTATVMPFFMASAPVGWTQVTTHNDKAIRIVSGAGAGSGGTVAFSTAFSSRAQTVSVANWTLTEAQMPGHTHGSNAQGAFNETPSGASATLKCALSGSATGSTGGWQAHNHTGSVSNLDMSVQYINMIIASKN